MIYYMPLLYIVPGRITEAATTPYLSNDKPGFHLIFIPPQSDLLILRYNIRYTLRGVNLWSMKTSTSPSVYLENLLPGNTHEIQINAESVIGSGNTYTFYQTTAKGISWMKLLYIYIYCLHNYTYMYKFWIF